MKKIIIGSCLILAVCIMVLVWAGSKIVSANRNNNKKIVELTAKYEASEKSRAGLQKQLDVINKAKIAEVTKEKAFAKKLDVALVGNGGGHISSYTAQLIAAPQAFKKYRFEGDVKDKAAVKAWAQTQAAKIAVYLGKTDWKFGGSIGIKEPNKVSPLLVEDSEGNLSVQEYVKGKDGKFPTSPKLITQHAQTLSQATFQAHEDVNGNFVANNSYEYFQLPEVQL